MAVVDRDGSHLDAVIAGVAHDLRGRIEAHRLRVVEGGAEHVGMMVLHPAARIGDLGEAGGMAFGEAVAAESLDLPEGALGKILRIAARDHAVDQLAAEMADPARELERRHRAAELVGLGRRKAGADDRDLHCLLLKQRDAQRLLEHGAQFGLRIFGLLLALPAAEIGMDHVALDRARPNDRDLDDQIIEFGRLDAGQHRHLRA